MSIFEGMPMSMSVHKGMPMRMSVHSSEVSPPRADRDPVDTGGRNYPGSAIEHLGAGTRREEGLLMTNDYKVTVTIDGEEFAVIDIGVVQGGERRHLSDLAPKTQERILRGIRNFLREEGGMVVEPLAALTVRQLREAQGIAIDHDRGAIDEHVARMARGAGGEFADAFGPPGAVSVAWESPPCEHYSDRQKKEGK